MNASQFLPFAGACVLLAFAAASPPVLKSQETAVVSKVLSYSAIQLSSGEKVTLIGIGAPPTGAFTPRDAKDRLQSIVLGKNVVLLADVAQADKKKEVFRYLYVNGEMVNIRMINDGYASAVRDIPYSKLPDFIAAETSARARKAGAWILDPEAAKNSVNLSVSPERITDVAILQYQIPIASNVSLIVLDGTGRVVASVINSRLNPGGYVAAFQRLTLPDGEYTCRLEACNQVISRKVMLTGRQSASASTVTPRDQQPPAELGARGAAAPASAGSMFRFQEAPAVVTASIVNPDKPTAKEGTVIR